MHADHEQNVSTSSVRLAGSSGANPYACIAAGGKLSLRWYDAELLKSTWQKDGETIVSGNNNLVDVDTSDIVQVEDLLNGSSITTDDVVITGIKVQKTESQEMMRTSYTFRYR